MAVENEIIVIALGILFGYIVQQSDRGKGNKLLANMIYLSCGIATAAFNTGPTYAAIGVIITLGSIVKGIVEMMPEKTE